MAIVSDSTGFVQARAAWRVLLDGTDLTDRLSPRLISLRLSERSGEEADELEIVLHDSTGDLAIPSDGAVLTVQLGWERGTQVPVGLVNKGTFTVDEVSWSGPPDRIAIRARSADLKQTFRSRTNKVWTDTTLSAIVSDIAAAQGLTARCHADLAQTAIASAEQGNKSPMQFLRDLSRRHDATASVKGGALIFAPVGATTTATGATIPTYTIRREQCASYAWRRAARDNAQDGAEAQWHDPGSAERKTTGTGGTNVKRLKKVYASEADAKAAAQAEANRLKRAAATLDLDLAFGDARLTPGVQIATTGFKSTFNDAVWLIKTATHDVNKNGYSANITMEFITK